MASISGENLLNKPPQAFVWRPSKHKARIAIRPFILIVCKKKKQLEKQSFTTKRMRRKRTKLNRKLTAANNKYILTGCNVMDTSVRHGIKAQTKARIHVGSRQFIDRVRYVMNWNLMKLFVFRWKFIASFIPVVRRYFRSYFS